MLIDPPTTNGSLLTHTAERFLTGTLLKPNQRLVRSLQHWCAFLAIYVRVCAKITTRCGCSSLGRPSKQMHTSGLFWEYDADMT
jgi:hypothetical protein